MSDINVENNKGFVTGDCCTNTLYNITINIDQRGNLKDRSIILLN